MFSVRLINHGITHILFVLEYVCEEMSQRGFQLDYLSQMLYK